MASFGIDLEIEILSRLPVKSLLRLRCVCRPWNFLITSSYFASKHLQYGHASFKKDGNVPLFFAQNQDIIPKTLCISPENKEVMIDPASLSFFRALKTFRTILGPVNGLYCIIVNRANGDRVCLCNPACKQIKVLPLVSHLTGKDYVSYGFGYDSINKDFKVVVFRKTCFIRSDKSLYYPAFVYSLNSDSNSDSKSNKWRQIDVDLGIFPKLLTWQTLNGMSIEKPFFESYVDGVVHWLVGTACILSFNFHDEVFRVFNLPLGIADRETYIAVLNGELMVFYKNVRGYWWKVWVMKEYGIENSWTILYDQEKSEILYFPEGFWKNGAEVVFYKLEKLKILYKSPSNKQKRKNFYNQGQLCTYMESLVSIQRGWADTVV